MSNSILTRTEFITEALNEKEYQILSTFINRLSGYTFTDSKQLNGVASMIFGKNMDQESEEPSDEYGGDTVIRYSDERFSISIYCETVPGGKSTVVKAELDEK